MSVVILRKGKVAWSLKDRTKKIKRLYSLKSFCDVHVLLLEMLGSSWTSTFLKFEWLLLLWNRLYPMASSKKGIYYKAAQNISSASASSKTKSTRTIFFKQGLI